MGGISGSRFPDCHHMCQQKWGVFQLADFLNAGKSAGNLWTVSKSASRNGVVFLPAYFLTATKFAGRNEGGYVGQEICWQKYPSLSAGTIADNREICLQIWWLSRNLLAEISIPFLLEDFLTVRKSASRNTHLFLVADLLRVMKLPADWVALRKFAGRNTPYFYKQIC